MSQTPEQPPPDVPNAGSEQRTTDEVAEPDVIAAVDFGLSRAEIKELLNTMLAVVKKAGYPAHLDPRDIVHAAYMRAREKPISARPSTTDRKKFVRWMCTGALFEVRTYRKSKPQQLLNSGVPEEEIETLLPACPPKAESIAAHEVWDLAINTLDPEDRALITAYYKDEKSIRQIAREQKRPWSTVDSHLSRILKRLRKQIVPAAIATLLLWTKKVQAFVNALVPRSVASMRHTSATLLVPVACGALVPANAFAPPGSTPLLLTSSGSSIPTVAGPVKPEAIEAVAPVKPNAVDTGKNPWSAAEMNTNSLRRFVQGTAVPAALVFAPALASSACAGTDKQTPAAQVPQYPDESPDPYEVECVLARARGGTCLSREEYRRAVDAMTVKH